MKKIIYISLFTVLGILAQFLVHAILEVWYIDLLISDFDTYGLGFTWQNWFLIHKVFTVILFVGGASLGFWQGHYWWKQIYVLKRWGKYRT